jgi:hypothetical protein
MAGEWLPVDIGLGQKPEVLELCDLSGQGVEVVVYRLLQLWGWASLNSADGTARATPERLARVCGGDAAFWTAVESVGWLEFDLEAGTATIPGWGRRFSAGAKARATHNDRQKRWRGANEARERLACASREEERRGQIPPPPREDATDGQPEPEPGPPGPATPDAAWEALRDAWNAGRRQDDPQLWRSPAPPDKAAARLQEAGWLDRAVQAVGHLRRCRWFETPVTLPQLCGRGFVDRVLAGQYDAPRPPGRARSGAYRGPDDRPPPQTFTGSDLEAFERTKAALAARMRQEGAA